MNVFDVLWSKTKVDKIMNNETSPPCSGSVVVEQAPIKYQNNSLNKYDSTCLSSWQRRKQLCSSWIPSFDGGVSTEKIA